MKKLLLLILIFVSISSNAVVTRSGKHTSPGESKYLSLQAYLKFLRKKGKKVSPKTDIELTDLLKIFSSRDQAVLAATFLSKHDKWCQCWRCVFLENLLEESYEEVKNEALFYTVEKTVSEKWAKVCEILIEFGADANFKVRNSVPLLYLAIEKQRPAVVDMLVECGAKLDVDDECGTTLTYALWNLCNDSDYLDVVGVILNKIKNLPYDEKIAIVNKQTDSLCSPLYFAIKFQDTDLVQRLVNMGSCVTTGNCCGKSPVMFSYKFRNQEIKEILELALDDAMKTI